MAQYISYTTLENEKRPAAPTRINLSRDTYLSEGQYVFPPFIPKPPPPPPAPKRQSRKDLPKAVEHTCLTEKPVLSKSAYRGSTTDEEIKYVNLTGRTLVECAVINCHVGETNATDCCFTNCIIVGGKLKDVELISCQVWKSNLDDISCTGVKFTDCDIHEAELKNCCFLDCKVKSCETKFSVKAQSTRFTDCTINLDAALHFSKQCKFIMCGGSGVPEAESSSSSDNEEGWGVQGNAANVDNNNNNSDVNSNIAQMSAEPSTGVLLANDPSLATVPQAAPLPDNFPNI